MNRFIKARFLSILVLISLVFSEGNAAPLLTAPVDKVESPSPGKPPRTASPQPDRVLPGEKSVRKSYLIPTLEIPAFIFLLNRFDYYFVSPRSDYDVTYHSTRDHLKHGPWVVDQDAFAINQIGHPYQGALYYGFARSAGLNYWESLVFSNLGSLVWEETGETTKPSYNDQVASGTAGSFIGEALYRLSNLVIEEGGKDPSTLRKIAAGAISPPTELNRLLFGDRYGPVLASRHPAIFSTLQLGAASNSSADAAGSQTKLSPTIEFGDFSVAYGLPGKEAYRYLRPFDYFSLEAQTLVDKSSTFTTAYIRGLLFGTGYDLGDSYRGVWGLYGSFDYVSPQVYRMSTTAASLGTTGQWWIWDKTALQGTAMAGVGYGSAGTISPDKTEPDYHYGVTPQELLALRLIMSRRLMLDVTGRNYFITGKGASKARGRERIQNVGSSLTARIFGRQALSVGYTFARRSARYDAGTIPSRDQLVRTVYVTYTLLGRPDLGAVAWGGNGFDD